MCLCQGADRGGLSVARWLGETDSAIIGTDGGTFAASDNLAFTFPPGAFKEPVTITYTTIPSITADMPNARIFYELTAVYTSNGQPAQLEVGKNFTAVIQYDEANLPIGVSENSLKLFYQTDTRTVRQVDAATAIWNPASSNVVDTVKNELTAIDSHLGTWAVLSSGYKVYLPAVMQSP